MTDTNLIPIENVNAVEIFHDEKTLQSLLSEIRKTATDFEPDISTVTGRQFIASQARKVAISKGVIDSAGKSLTEDWFKRKKIVDAGRKIARDTLDLLRDEIRQPLTDWETEEKAKAKALALQAEIAADENDAYAMDDLFEREKKVREHEERIEAERLEAERKETEAREESERKSNEERIRKEAEDKARQDSEAEIQLLRDEAERAENERIEASLKAEREHDEALKRERQEAKDEAERKEKHRLWLIEEKEREAQVRAADRENRRKVNKSIVKALVEGGVSHRAAVSAVTLIASGKIQNVSIRY